MISSIKQAMEGIDLEEVKLFQAFDVKTKQKIFFKVVVTFLLLLNS